MTTIQKVITIFAVVAGTMLTRFLPFLILPGWERFYLMGSLDF